MNTQKRNKVAVMIPTYNERDNIEALIHDILKLDITWGLSILVVDDDSPDGTGELVKKMAEKDKRLILSLRKKRRGRGAAGIHGFKEALKLNPECIIEMDGDFSHQPRYIPRLLSLSEKYDIVIGSRFVKGGKDLDRNIFRRLVTFLARNFLRHKFKIPVRDISSGFRCFKKEVLEKVDLDDCISTGPSIVLEILYRANLLGFTLGEVPIVFIDRIKGQTKLTLLTLMETLVTSLIIKKRLSEFGLKKSS